jgi:hypothetical protein
MLAQKNRWNVEFTTCTNCDADVGLSHSINREDTKCVSAAAIAPSSLHRFSTLTTCNNDDSESPSYRVCCRRFGFLPDAQCLSRARRHFAVRLVVMMYLCVSADCLVRNEIIAKRRAPLYTSNAMIVSHHCCFFHVTNWST